MAVTETETLWGEGYRAGYFDAALTARDGVPPMGYGEGDPAEYREGYVTGLRVARSHYSPRTETETETETPRKGK